MSDDGRSGQVEEIVAAKQQQLADKQDKSKPEKIFLVYHRKGLNNYLKFKALLQNQGWTRIEWLQDLASLRLKLEQIEGYGAGASVCLALIRPLPKMAKNEPVLQLISSRFNAASPNRSLLIADSCCLDNAGVNLDGAPAKNGDADDEFEDGDDDDSSSGNFNNKLLARLKCNVRFRRDCVIGMSPLSMDLDKLYHPREVKLSVKEDEFIVNRGLSQSVRDLSGLNGGYSMQDGEQSASTPIDNICMLYPHGCTLKLLDGGDKSTLQTVIMMTTSGQNCLPKTQPICAFHQSNLKLINSFKLIAFGSSKMFANDYIECENNSQIVSSLLHFLNQIQQDGDQEGTQQTLAFAINMSDANTLEVEQKFTYRPNIESILDYPLVPMSESKKLPANKSELFDSVLFNLDNSMMAKMSRAFQDLGVEQRPLSLIKPEFAKQSLPLEPAYHNFLIRRLT